MTLTTKMQSQNNQQLEAGTQLINNASTKQQITFYKTKLKTVYSSSGDI